MELLVRFGINPWREATYDFQTRCFRMLHSKLFESSETIAFEQVRDRADAAPAKKVTRSSNNGGEGDDLNGPPNYLIGICERATKSGPARLLADGKWSGHGEKNFWLYDIAVNHESEFMLQLPYGDGPLVVRVVRQSGGPAFLIYESRRHPADAYYESQEPSASRPVEVCSKCGSALYSNSRRVRSPARCRVGKRHQLVRTGDGVRRLRFDRHRLRPRDGMIRNST